MRPQPLTAAAALAVALGAGAADRPAGHTFATRSVVYARHGMVAAAHPLAAEIGLDVLKKGGSAVDAAIATNAALGFVEPMSCGVGGDLFALVWDAKTGKLYGLNASGRAPRGARAEDVGATAAGTIPDDSPWSWTVPGAVDGWAELHARFGRLPMADLLAPSIRAAREGEAVPQVIASAWATAAGGYSKQPGFAAVYMPGGRPPVEGEVFKNPALARTYEAIARGGRDGFYKGEVARELVAFSHANGGAFSEQDLAEDRAEWVDPISTDYRGVRVYELPPNSQGLVALEMLNILEAFDLKAMGRDSSAFWHTLVEAKKLAFEDRARYIADPAFSKLPVAGLLAKDYGRQRAKLIDATRAASRLEPGQPRGGDTTYLAAADGEGNMVSLIQSNYDAFGSGYAPESLGFAIQNRGALFNLKPGLPNSLVAGRRPFHTIIPAFAMRDGKPWLAFGLMGGDMQPQGHVQVIVNLVDFGMNLQEAGDAARFRHAGSSEPTGVPMSGVGTLFLESGVPPEVRRDLARMGHKVEEAVGVYGGYQAIARDPVTGVLAGATESRKDGCAIGY